MRRPRRFRSLGGGSFKREFGFSFRVRRKALGLAILGGLLLSGCAYTSKTNLPDHIRSVHVARVPSAIDITGDVSTKAPFKIYRPGLEVELRNAAIEEIIFDGHLKVASSKKTADAFLMLALMDFRRDPLRYDLNDTIQEYRIIVVAKGKLLDRKTGRILWRSDSISGNATYFLAGPLAASEDEAVQKALQDLARHLVESILEVW